MNIKQQKKENELIWESLNRSPAMKPRSKKSIATVKGTHGFVPSLADITDPREKQAFAEYIAQAHELIDSGEWTPDDLQQFANDERNEYNARRAAIQVLINIDHR